MRMVNTYPNNVQFTELEGIDVKEILTPEVATFLTELSARFESERLALLENRVARQKELEKGKLPDFLSSTEHIRNGDWVVGEIPKDLLDRRVEITGPSSDRKMVINAFNSGANVFMADFEDANSPTWKNCIAGQINLRDSITGKLTFSSDKGKYYKLHDKIATLIVRPRGWHLLEKHFLVDGKPISASLFDFGVYFYLNANKLLENGSGPYFYLPKLESHKEAKLWNDVFVFAQERLGIPNGTVKATVLIETIMAVFEADEILYALREHSAGLNCGRWDYIFSYLKKLRHHQFLLPDRSEVTMTVPFMSTYTNYVVKVCHKRNAHAIGGMSALIPVKGDQEKNKETLEKVRADKEREARDGHDGSWVAHPGLVQVVKNVFDELMPMPNQIHLKKADFTVIAKQLLEVPSGNITEEGLRTNISVGIQYIEAWLDGKGAVPINNLMEDAATAEISRAQVWQWIRHSKAILPDGRDITPDLVQELIDEELLKIEHESSRNRKFKEAVNLFKRLVLQDEYIDFLTLPGYESID